MSASTAKGRLVELALAGAWIVGLGAALQLVEQLLGPANLGGALFGALAVDLGTGRAGVRWDWDAVEGVIAPARASWAASPIVRLVKGAALTTALVAVLVVASLALRWASVGSVAAPSFALAFAAARAAAFAVRDELLFRGLPNAAASRANVSPGWALAFGGLASGAAVMLTPGATIAAILFAVASGLLFATLWRRGRGAWMAVGAHFALRFGLGSIVHGGVVDLDWANGELAVGAAASGAPAWLAITLCVVMAVVVARTTHADAKIARPGH